MSQLEVSPTNWSTGAGIVDSFNGLVAGVRHAQDGDRAAAAAEIGIGVVSSVLDVVSVGLDPLAKLTAVGLGWLIEHVAFLREPLDMLAGDPKAVAGIAESLHEYAQDLRNAGEDMNSSARSHTASWEGRAADSCRQSVDEHAQRMESAGKAVDTTGYVVETTMAVITAVRALIRDMITSVLGDIVSTMIVALAAAAWTFGASLVVGVSRCVILAVTEVTRMMTKVGQVAGLSARAARRIDSLVDILGKLTKDSRAAGGVRALAAPRPGTEAAAHGSSVSSSGSGAASASASAHGGASATGSRAGTGTTAPTGTGTPAGGGFHDDGLGTDVFRDWLAMDRVLNPTPGARGTSAPGSATGSATGSPRASTDSAGSVRSSPAPSSASSASSASSIPPVALARDSPLKRYEIPWMKKHENRLRNSRFSDAFGKVKGVENYTRSHLPKAFPTLKAMADLKSSKNYVGLANKFSLTLGKSLTDIQRQAQGAWAASDQRQQQGVADGVA